MTNSVRTYEDPVSWAPGPRARWFPTPADDALVEAKRRLRASWDAVAGMLNRPVHDVRRFYDPTYPVAPPLPPIATLDVEKPKRHYNWTPRRRSVLPSQNTIRYSILELLSDGVQRTNAQIVEALGGQSPSIGTMLSGTRKRGFLRSLDRGLYVITDKGLAEKAAIDARAESDGSNPTALQKVGRGGAG